MLTLLHFGLIQIYLAYIAVEIKFPSGDRVFIDTE